MRLKKKVFTAIGVLAVLVIVGTAVVLQMSSPSGGDTSNSTTPLGGLFNRATAVSRLKQKMGDLREVFPAMASYAREHQDDLPKTIADLHPYLPAKLASLDDQHWEIPSSGKMAPLTSSSSAASQVLLREKDTPPGKGRIVLYADGHIEYKKE
jgi:prepilin-type processing-associated H-X9-DG protein